MAHVPLTALSIELLAVSGNGWPSTATRVIAKVDAVDWVERIPIAETRNCFQRVMENLQVYSARPGASVATIEPNLHRATNVELRTKPTFVNALPQ
jgi:hypothetical protein